MIEVFQIYLITWKAIIDTYIYYYLGNLNSLNYRITNLQTWMEALTQQIQQDTSSNLRANNTRDIWPHGMHKQEIMWTRFKANFIGNPVEHWHSSFNIRFLMIKG